MCKIISFSNNVGYPNIFSTMTCNHQRPEIRNTLLLRQSVFHRPDIAARVFRITTRHDGNLTNETVFEERKAHVRFIEFQKQGHSHILCKSFMTPASNVNLLSPTFVDTIISAKTPDDHHSLLRQVVLSHKMHNPCGNLNPSAVCMTGNIYPKRFLTLVTGIFNNSWLESYSPKL